MAMLFCGLCPAGHRLFLPAGIPNLCNASRSEFLFNYYILFYFKYSILLWTAIPVFDVCILFLWFIFGPMGGWSRIFIVEGV